MKKPAQTQYPIHTILAQRWSPRSFSDQPVETEKLLSNFEAARWAASSRNQQPWNFIAATKDYPAEYERLLQCLMDRNMLWAQRAPVLMISIAQLKSEQNDQPNRFAFHDTALAVANLITQASALDLYTHQMGGIHRDKVREIYQLPETHEPVAGIALGYLGDPEELSDELHQREMAPRARKPLTEFVFSGSWNQTAPFLDQS